MSLSKLSTFCGLLAISAFARAHMVITSPTPFSDVTTSPLNADGSNYPCQLQFGAPAKANAPMQIGAPQTLAFGGVAVHGGGSCQVALTTDNPPTKSTVWMVIKSIEGGCPCNTTTGNLDQGPDPTTFTYEIPEGIAPGNYVLAWTWFNKVGNREMYMNCAPITVTAAANKKRMVDERRAISRREILERRANFPNIMIANIGIGPYTTTEGVDYLFPDPGAVVERAGNPGNYGPFLKSGSPAPVGPGAAPSSAPSSSPAAPVASSVSSAVSSMEPTSTEVIVSAVTSTITTVASSPATAAPSVTSAVASSAPAAPTSGGSSSSSGLSGACSTEGMFNCIGTNYQQCASGSWTAMRALAAGTTCQQGQSMGLWA